MLIIHSCYLTRPYVHFPAVWLASHAAHLKSLKQARHMSLSSKSETTIREQCKACLQACQSAITRAWHIPKQTHSCCLSPGYAPTAVHTLSAKPLIGHPWNFTCNTMQYYAIHTHTHTQCKETEGHILSCRCTGQQHCGMDAWCKYSILVCCQFLQRYNKLASLKDSKKMFRL